MSAVIDIAKDIAESVKNNHWHVWLAGRAVDITEDSSLSPICICTLWCDTDEEAARVVALARGEK